MKRTMMVTVILMKTLMLMIGKKWKKLKLLTMKMLLKTTSHNYLNKERKKQVDVDELLRQQINRMKKELQVEMHKTHLLCLLSRGFYLNRLTYHPLISSLALSHLTSFTFDLKKINLLFVRDFTNWFRSWFNLEKKPRSKTDLLDSLTQAFETNVVHSQVAYVLMFLAFLRIYSPKIQLRLCYALNPIPIKPDNLIMTEKQRSKAKSSKDDPEESSKPKSKPSNKTADKKLPSDKLNAGKNDSKTKKTSNTSSSRGKKRKKSSDEEDEDYEMDSDDEKRSKAKGKGKGKGKQKTKVLKVENKSIISEDDSNDLMVVKTTEDKNLLEYWCEIYVETEEKWICVDVESGTWDNPSKIEKRSHNPLLYVVSWDNFSHVKDVSQRYCSDFASCKFRRSRIDEDWWTETLSFFRPRKRTRQEKREIKNWLKYLLTDRYFLRDLPLELFGEWQTDPYIPPEAKDGKVPRNQYGNVELFQPCMLPKGTVYLQLPGLIRIANKLKIDCAPAVVGFDNCSGGAGVHPVFEGFVVCEEFADTLKAAWEEEQMNIRKRELEKREKRIYGNWKKLIVGVLIKEQVKLKYNRDQSEDTEAVKSSGITLDDIDTILSMYAKKRRKGPSKANKTKSSAPTKKSNKRKSKKGKDTSDEEDEDEDDDIDDFIVDDDEDLEEDGEKIKNDEEEEAETELELSDSD
uniref:Rad4 beta-hairpin domain-containing protein n=1 Tax=Tetranychus urticae TaxID=32264 RepID=T1L5L6_TETUR